MTWRDYWNQDTPIYVNARHKAVHYDVIARQLADALPPGDTAAGPAVLDFGCGEALSADVVAKRCQVLHLCDGAELVRSRLRQKFGLLGNVVVMSPEQLGEIPAGSLDLIVVNSVLQYLSRADLDGLLAMWKRLAETRWPTADRRRDPARRRAAHRCHGAVEARRARTAFSSRVSSGSRAPSSRTTARPAPRSASPTTAKPRCWRCSQPPATTPAAASPTSATTRRAWRSWGCRDCDQAQSAHIRSHAIAWNAIAVDPSSILRSVCRRARGQANVRPTEERLLSQCSPVSQPVRMNRVRHGRCLR